MRLEFPLIRAFVKFCLTPKSLTIINLTLGSIIEFLVIISRAKSVEPSLLITSSSFGAIFLKIESICS